MEILTAPEFDEAAYRAKADKIHELRGFMKLRLTDAVIELAKQFDQEERRSMVKHLRRPPKPPKDVMSPRRPGRPDPGPDRFRR